MICRCDFCGKPAEINGKTIYGYWQYMCPLHNRMYGLKYLRYKLAGNIELKVGDNVASKFKKGKFGMTRPRSEVILGTVIVCNKQFDNIEGEIISRRNDRLKYLTVQVPSEYKGRVYVLNLLYEQCKDIIWRNIEH